MTVGADVLLKQSLGRPTRLVVGILIYATTALLVATAFRLSQFGELFIIWEAGTVLGGLLIAALIFGEPFTTRRVLAASFALAAILLAI